MSFSTTTVQKVAENILVANYLVSFTGAGISTESGLPDFRGPNGVWTRRDKGLAPPLPAKPLDEIEPNIGHYALVELQNMGILKFLISQNVDNLHLRSGIRRDLIAELHGNKTLMKCLNCDSRYTKSELSWNDRLFGEGYRTQRPHGKQPRCPACQGRIIASIINFGDPMPEKELEIAQKHIDSCDVCMVVGSSLVVYPAADYPLRAKNNGAKLIIINSGKTGLDKYADLKIEAKAGAFLHEVVIEIKKLRGLKQKDRASGTFLES